MTRLPLATRIALPALLLAAGFGCDYTGDFLFAGEVENLPGVMHIGAEDGSTVLTPIDANSVEELEAGIIYGEIGPTGTAEKGGATMNFIGTGGPICVFVDPETIFWNWSVSPVPSTEQKIWNWPDNVFDDGDIDLFVGLSAYYTGSPGIEVGDFFVDYTDALGNPVGIELSACSNIGLSDQLNAHAGRGFPEMCNLPFTDPGVSYTALLQTFSTPLDDDRLSYGLILYNGSCSSLINVATGVPSQQQGDAIPVQECVITGESLVPEPTGAKGFEPYCVGKGCKPQWPDPLGIETEFCLGAAGDLRKKCRKEFNDKFEAGEACNIEAVSSNEERCFCGDQDDLPAPGAL